MNKYWLLVLGLVLLVGNAGCRNLASPNWFHPGPAEYQQARAQHYDPYPENEPGPELVGVRPREYENPRAEVLRVQPRLNPLNAGWLPWNWRWQ